MSIASPTLRSSSSTAPGPSRSRSPISMRVRPSTADTCTGTSNTASRSPALRDVMSASGASGTSSGRGMTSSLRSSSGSRTLVSSLMGSNLQTVSLRGRLAAAGRDVTADGLADHGLGRGAVAREPAVGPFDAAVAERHAGFGKHYQAPLETVQPGDLFELRLGGLVDRLGEAHHDMRRGDQMVEAGGSKRGD